jgi:hypothetical protein
MPIRRFLAMILSQKFFVNSSAAANEVVALPARPSGGGGEVLVRNRGTTWQGISAAEG